MPSGAQCAAVDAPADWPHVRGVELLLDAKEFEAKPGAHQQVDPLSCN